VTGLRQQKKAQSREAIALAANRLFAEHGYRSVRMTQVAALAGVSDQTLYNYFPTKESLVFDKSEHVERALLASVADRPPGVDLVDAFSQWLQTFMLGDAGRRALQNPGGMPRLVNGNDALRRMLLDIFHASATRFAVHLHEVEALPEPMAFVVADALLGVTVRAIEQVGAAVDESELALITTRATASLDLVRPLLLAARG
jgi:AcrR family transcriptional regulator